MKLIRKKSLTQKLATIALALSFSAVCVSETLSVEYKSFYSHVRKLDKDETNALQFAFGFINIHSKKLCTIEAARISTEKQQIPLTVSPEYRFTVPSEKALRLADALIVLDLVEPANTCDMSVQLETKPQYLKRQYAQKDLVAIMEQYKAFFDDMGGFLSFMMPKVVGIKMTFSEPNLNATLADGLTIKDGLLHMNIENLNTLSGLILPTRPLRITAITDS